MKILIVIDDLVMGMANFEMKLNTEWDYLND